MKTNKRMATLEEGLRWALRVLELTGILEGENKYLERDTAEKYRAFLNSEPTE